LKLQKDMKFLTFNCGLMIFDSYPPWNWKRLNMALKLWLSAGAFVALTTHLVNNSVNVKLGFLILGEGGGGGVYCSQIML
jgi:hypothetical protein